MKKKKQVKELRKEQAEFFEDTEKISKYRAKEARIRPIF